MTTLNGFSSFAMNWLFDCLRLVIYPQCPCPSSLVAFRQLFYKSVDFADAERLWTYWHDISVHVLHHHM